MRLLSTRNSFLSTILLAAFFSGCMTVRADFVAEPQAGSVTKDTGNLALSESEQTVHIDPQTGQISVPTALSGQIQKPQINALTASSQLQEKLSPVSGGGVMIHLDRQFRTPLTATIDKDGRASVKHQLSNSKGQ